MKIRTMSAGMGMGRDYMYKSLKPLPPCATKISFVLYVVHCCLGFNVLSYSHKLVLGTGAKNEDLGEVHIHLPSGNGQIVWHCPFQSLYMVYFLNYCKKKALNLSSSHTWLAKCQLGHGIIKNSTIQFNAV